MIPDKPKFLYYSFSNVDHSLNAVYVKGLRANGVIVVHYASLRNGFARLWDFTRQYFRHRRDVIAIIVGYDSPLLVIWMRLISGKPIVYNALCSVYERLIISRELSSKYSIKSYYYLLLDFFAVRMATLTMLESQHQIDYFVELFKVNQRKFTKAWTGVDGEKFYFDPNMVKKERFTVIFRGRLLPEAGAEYVVRAAKLLENENIDFIMHSFGIELPKIKLLISKLKPKNLTLIEEGMQIEKLRELMLSAHLSLGQLSNHKRLERTIPHKAYESLALKLPYLTARNPGILELLTEGKTCIACNPADSEDLARKIKWAKVNQSELQKISEAAFSLYQERLQSKFLGKIILDKLL